MARETLYEVLQVRATAEAEVIEGAYKRLVGKYHPDKNRSPGLQELNEAFRILRDPALRAAYDEERRRHLKSEHERREREKQEERNGSASVGSATGPPIRSEAPPQILPTPVQLTERRTHQSPRRLPSRAHHPPPAKPPRHDRRQPPARPLLTRRRASGAGLFGPFSRLERICSSHACAPDHRVPTAPPPLADAAERRAPVVPAPPPRSGPRLRTAASVCVVNTAGQGVYLRSLPRLDTRFGAAYSEGTTLRVLEDECAAGGTDAQEFCLVAAPDGSTGYVPSKYLSSVCVARAPARTVPVTPEPQPAPAAVRCVWESDCPTGSRCEYVLGQGGRCVVSPDAPARRSLLGGDNFPTHRSPMDE